MNVSARVAAAAVPAEAPAPVSGAEAPGDFMALLLLLSGVGIAAPRPEGVAPVAAEPVSLPAAPPADGDAETGATPAGAAAPDLALHLLAAAIPAATPHVAEDGAPHAAPVVASAPPAPAPVEADAAGTRRASPESRPAPADHEATRRPAAPSRAVAPSAATAVEGATTSETAPAVVEGSPVKETPPAPRRPGGEVRATREPAGDATPDAASSAPAGGRRAAIDDVPRVQAGAAAPDSRGEGPQGGGGERRDPRSNRESARAAMAVPVAADAPRPVAAARETEPAAAPAPAPAVDPAAVTGQVVRAARLVVDSSEARMRVDLDPPALGAVTVSAETRGGAVQVTIVAERPETQALLAQALPDIRQALSDRGVGGAAVSLSAPHVTPDGRRAPDRRPAEPRERPTPQPGDRRRAAAGARRVSAVDVTV